MRKVLEITFSGEEFRVVTADTPDAALKKARSEKPSLFLVDVTLPGQDGYTFCKTLKSEFPGVPVLILSSKQGPYDSAKGSAAGADEFADKPFDTQQLIDKVKRVLQNKGAAKVEAAPAPAPAPTPATKPGGGTLPGAAPVTSANAPRAGAPQTQSFGSSSRSPGATQVGVGPSLKPASPTLGTQPDTRTRTASGLGTAAAQAQAQAQAQKPTQPAIPAQIQPTPKPAPAVEAPAPEAAPPAAPAAPSPVAAAVDAQLGEKIAGLGLSPAQADAVLALSREVVERIVWEVVPVLAETLIKEEIKRLTSE
ncbi:MAG: response regulator [Polyangiaceae bacterium]|jgi:DNA-binding response OmpR family regulator|nr:response regulator [Polyangiaceae bacterium]